MEPDRIGSQWGVSPRQAITVVAVAAVAVGCAGAHGATRRTAPTASGQPPSAASRSPAPTRTVIRSGPVYRAGHPATVIAQDGVVLDITASRPTVSTTRLSSSYGYPPQHGYYVTFAIAIANRGAAPVAIGPMDFFVRVAGQGKVTSYDGNSPYSGASRQLDTTELDPGQSVRAPLTFDVRRPHGRLAFAPDRSAAVTWVF